MGRPFADVKAIRRSMVRDSVRTVVCTPVQSAWVAAKPLSFRRMVESSESTWPRSSWTARVVICTASQAVAPTERTAMATEVSRSRTSRLLRQGMTGLGGVIPAAGKFVADTEDRQ